MNDRIAMKVAMEIDMRREMERKRDRKKEKKKDCKHTVVKKKREKYRKEKWQGGEKKLM